VIICKTFEVVFGGSGYVLSSCFYFCQMEGQCQEDWIM